MKHLIIAISHSLGGLALRWHVLFCQRPRPDVAFGRLLHAPQRSIQNPYHNGYFYLIGLMAASPLDPAKTGYEIWVEETEDARRGASEKGKPTEPTSSSLSHPSTTSAAWEADDPLHEFRKKEAPFRAAASQYHILLTRYERWLGMPFDDWGFGRKVVPLGKHILAIHRLYVARRVFRQDDAGTRAASKGTASWRTVLREAKTIDTKVFAQVMITDDFQLLSRILAKPMVDKAIVTMGLQLTLPLSEAEYSLRWPIRHQVALAVKEGAPRSRSDHPADTSKFEP